MSSSSSPSSDLLSAKLNESNYNQWAIKMKSLLMAKKLWMHVKGLVPKPSPSSDAFSDWLNNAYAASGLIFLNIEDSEHTHVQDMDDDPAKV